MDRLFTKIILLATPLLIIVDSINGALLRGMGIAGFGQAIKFAYLALLALHALQFRTGILWTAICVATNALFILVHSFFNLSTDSLVFDLQWLLRFNIIWIGYVVFRRLTHRNLVDERYVFRTFLFVYSILVINLIIGFLGIGYSQYGKFSESSKIGAVGFIFAGNEMSFLMLLCQIVILGLVYYRNKSLILYVISSLVFIGLAILKITKVAVIGSVLVSASIPLFDVARGLLSFRLYSLRAPIIAGATLLILVAASPVAIDLILRTGIMNRIEYFLDKHGALYVIFSGRHEFLAEFITEVWFQFSFVEYLFGPGRYEMLERLGHPVEIDLFDIAGGFGMAGVILYYGFFIVRGIQAFLAARSKDEYGLIAFIIVAFTFAISLTAGHVIYSGMAAPFFALSLGFLLSRYRRHACGPE